MTDEKDIYIRALQEEIISLKSEVKALKRSDEAIEAAGFDVWENNFVTGETFGTNRRLFKSLGYSEDELPKNLDETFERIHPDDLRDALDKVKKYFAGDLDNYRAEMRIKAKDGTWVWIGSYGGIVEKDQDQNVTRFIGLTFNIDSRRIMEETTKRLAYIDSLTQLANRRKLFEVGRTEVLRASRYGHPLSLMVLDIDDFKFINDTYGHLTGDDILVQVAKIMQKTFREVDLKVRFGGDEFVILLADTYKEEAMEIAERLRKHIEEEKFGIPSQVTMSIGVTEWEKDHKFSELLEQGDQALYLSKKSGKNVTREYIKKQ